MALEQDHTKKDSDSGNVGLEMDILRENIYGDVLAPP